MIEQWDTNQDFFLIRQGTVDILVDGGRIARLGPDEFFGEIAALDWGAGFGYPRIAQVVAAEPLEFSSTRTDGCSISSPRSRPSKASSVRQSSTGLPCADHGLELHRILPRV